MTDVGRDADPMCDTSEASPMSDQQRIDLEPIGRISSLLTDLGEAPRQGDEGAPTAAIEVEPKFLEALTGLEVGDRLIVLTWLHRGDRSVLAVHPRDDPSRGRLGVFATRSSDRPNPIGLHEVELLGVDGSSLRIGPIEALDGTPVLDIKPVLADIDDR